MLKEDKKEIRDLVKKYYRENKQVLFSKVSLSISKRFAHEMKKQKNLTQGERFLSVKFFKELIKKEIDASLK